jgi:hypothetical protein
VMTDDNVWRLNMTAKKHLHAVGTNNPCRTYKPTEDGYNTAGDFVECYGCKVRWIGGDFADRMKGWHGHVDATRCAGQVPTFCHYNDGFEHPSDGTLPSSAGHGRASGSESRTVPQP